MCSNCGTRNPCWSSGAAIKRWTIIPQYQVESFLIARLLRELTVQETSIQEISTCKLTFLEII